MDKRREFAEQYREKVEPIDIRKYQREAQVGQQNKRIARQEPSRYTAPKGTAHRAKRRKRKPNTKLAALILAAAIGVGGISLINQHDANKPQPTNMIEIQQDGVTSQSLGLSETTVELFEKYDEYFENFDKNNQYNLTDEQIIGMINEIESMHFSTVKEKMGSLIGEEPKNIRMYYEFEKANGEYYTSIVINEDSYNREVYSSSYSTWPFPSKNCIPSELSKIILQLRDLKSLESDVRTDKITKINAVKKLEKLYEALEQVATGDFVKDEKGNISIIHYEDKQAKQQKEDKERD